MNWTATEAAGPATAGEAADPALAGETLRRFREILVAAKYPPEDLRVALGSSDPLSALAQLPAAAFADKALSVLTKLFLLGREVEQEEAAATVAPLPLETLEHLGLLKIAGDRVSSPVRIDADDGAMVASDPVQHRERPDFVTGVNPSSRTLARLTIRRRVGSALDLGSSSGVQSLLAAQHCDRVIGVDINPRALPLAELNARLNARTNVSFLQGSWFAPVQGRRFDLIVCNPPYVISPDTSFVYRDSGLPRDGICQMLVGETPGFLSEGGFATIVCNWIATNQTDWAAPLLSWVEGRGCDAVLLLFGCHDPVPYAAGWNQHLRGEANRFEESLRRWVDFYRKEGIEKLCSGAVILRRRSATRNWVLALEASSPPGDAAGAQLERIFHCRDQLAEIGDDALLDKPVTLLDHALDQRLVFSGGRYVVQPAAMRLPAGLGVEGRIDPQVLAVLLACDGIRPLRALVRETAIDPTEVEALESASVAVVRTLLQRGLIRAP